MSFPKYPEYKDSGVEWLGDVPAHWRIEPLKWHCDVMPSNVDKKSAEGEQPVLLCNYTDVYYNDQITVALDFMKATASNSQIDRFTLRQGDVVFTKDSESPEDIAVSAFVPLDLPGIVCGYHLAIARSHRTLIGKFLKWYFDSQSAKAYFCVSANGLTRVGLSQYASDNLPLPLPSLREQENISAFLDHETARIDALVAEQQRLIELLKEKRQAVISHAVTKGLNPDVPMKDSGVEWLGEVPAHWEVTKLSYITNRIGSGKTPSGGATAYVTSGVPFIRSQNVHDQGLRLNDIVYIDGATDREMAWSRVKPLDVLINITGASIGRACQVPSEFGRANVNQHVCVIRLDKAEEVADWVAWTMKATSTKEQVKVSQTGAAREGLNFQQLAGFYICMPSLKERRTISAFLKQETARIDALVKEGESVINLLQERRSALISAAVTGKIDVRGWQPPPGSSDPTETTAMEPA